jgi:hypothetical protein
VNALDVERDLRDRAENRHRRARHDWPLIAAYAAAVVLLAAVAKVAWLLTVK